MPDVAERVVLEAEDVVTPAVDKANTALGSFENKAEAAHAKVTRITDQTRTSVQRLISSLEKQAEMYGKSGVEKLIAQKDQLLARYAKEPQAIEAITRSYERMIAVEKKLAEEAAVAKHAKEVEEALKKESEAIRGYGEKVSQFVESPMQGARSAIMSALSSVGPFGIGVAAGGTALLAFGAAAFEAAKSLGEYGVRIKDAELRTGLTAKEVGQFSFAAKAVGQDISIVERLMRGLSQAANENSTEGEKARATMHRLGIEVYNSSGQLKPTVDILTEISEALNRLPEGLQRDAVAMDLFKRVGIEAIPFMTELNENLRIAHEQGFGPTEDDVRRFQEYQREVAQLETKWDALVRKFKEGIVISVSWTGNAVDWFLKNVASAGDEERDRRERQQALEEDRAVRAAGGYGASMSRAAHRAAVADTEKSAAGVLANRDLVEGRIADLTAERERLIGGFGALQILAPTEQELRDMKRATDLQKEILQLQDYLDQAVEAGRRKELRGGKEETERLRALFFGTREGMDKAYAEAKKDVEKYRKELFDSEKPLTQAEVRELDGKLQAAQQTEARLKAQIDAAKKAEEELKHFHAERDSWVKKGAEAELDAIGKIRYERDLLLTQAEKLKASEAEIAGIRLSADRQVQRIWIDEAHKIWNKVEEHDAKALADHKPPFIFDLWEKDEERQRDEWRRAGERVAGLGVDAQREELLRQAARAQRMATATTELAPMAVTDRERREASLRREEQAAQQAYQTRVNLAIQLAQIETARIEKEQNAATRAVLAAEAMKDLYTGLAAAEDDLAQKRADVAQKRAQELQRQYDELQKTTADLLHTLFTRPENFGKQLRSTLTEAMLRPVTQSMSVMLSNAVHPLVFGVNGQGGVAGLFQGAFGGQTRDPVKLSTDINTAATAQNSAAVAALTAVLASYMGLAVPAIGSPAISGVAGAGLPAIGVPVVGGGTLRSTTMLGRGGLELNAPGGARASVVMGGGTVSMPIFLQDGIARGGAAVTAPAAMPAAASTEIGWTPPSWATSGASWSGTEPSLTEQVANLPVYHSSSSLNPWALVNMGSRKTGSIIPGSGFNPRAMWGNIKNTDWGGFTRDKDTGAIKGMHGVAGAAVFTGGTMLAEHGLMGSSRGTWGGVGEGAAGGAMAGFAAGGPLGAAIGAVAGFGIGVGEVLAGVKSPELKAHEYIQSIYGVYIPTNSATIKQVVGIAQSQYAGDISVAVRSPSVRQLVMLYSQATGQKLPMSAATPYAGMLVEQGGNLYQQASFQGDQWNAYASSLPTLGGIVGSPYPVPVGPNTSGGTGINLALNINGTPITPAFVMDQSVAAQDSSYGRTQQAANVQVPGLMVA